MRSFAPYLGLLVAFASLSAASEESPPVMVETVIAVRTDTVVSELNFTGTVASQRRARLSSRAEGLVDSVLVDAGGNIEEGEVLLSLDPRLAEIELDLIRAEKETAQVQFEDAERERKEVMELTASGAFAKTEAESRNAMVRIRAAELKALEVREQQQMERIERHRLVAPFSGSIARKMTEAGEWVETGTPVLELIDTQSLWVELQIAQEFLAAVRGVEEATVTLDAFPRQPLTAEIETIVPVKDPVSRTFLTRLTFDDPEKLASPGMSASVSLKSRPDRPASVSIPRDAVTRYPDGSAKVWIVREENGGKTTHSVSIVTTNNLGESVEVEEGLQGGEQVIVRGNEGLEEGQAVTTREYRPETSPSSL